MSRDTVIDAVAAADEAERTRVVGDRGASTLGDVKRRSTPGARILFGMVLLLIIAGMGALAWHALTREDSEEAAAAKPTEDSAIRNTMPGLKNPEQAATAAAPALVPEGESADPIKPDETTPAATGSGAAGGTPPPSPAELLRKRRLESPLRATAASTKAEAATGDPATDQARMGTSPAGAGSAPGQQQTPPSMADRLSPVRLSAARAGQVGSMDLLLLQSAMIDCAMNVRVDSTVPGMMSCDATRDVYSTNGRTVVLDRGTRFTGRYERGVVKGEGRIFVVWERAVTPSGVIVNLDSPGTDPLGGSGFPGKINNHFWQRFGAAILISVFEDAGDYAVAKANEGNNTYYGGNTTDAARDNSSIVLENQINIPPTLTKRHGDRVSIFVARDLDFSGIYELRRKYR